MPGSPGKPVVCGRGSVHWSRRAITSYSIVKARGNRCSGPGAAGPWLPGTSRHKILEDYVLKGYFISPPTFLNLPLFSLFHRDFRQRPSLYSYALSYVPSYVLYAH